MSKLANRFCIAAMIVLGGLVLVLGIAGVVVPDKLTCNVNGVSSPCSTLTPGAVIFTVAAVASVMALLLKGLYHLSCLFRNYAAGQIFTKSSVEQIRRFGVTVLAYGVLQVLLLVAAAILMGLGQISWWADQPIPIPFAAFVAGGLILLISWVMDVGTELREENELTV